MKFSRIYVEISNICNLNCSFCSKTKREKKEMTIDEFKIVISKIKKYTNTIYLHIKGEPLLHSNLEDILSICNQNNINIKITTNGTLLSKKLDILKKYKIKQINVSLHSENNKENYFKEVFDTCTYLSNNTTIVYRIWVLNNMKLDKLSTNIVDKIKEYYNLSTNIVDKIIENKNIKIKDNIYLDKDNEFIWPNSSNNEYIETSCLGTRTHIGILSDGTVVPCCLDSEGIINLGNIFNEELDDILNSNLFKSINNGFRNSKVICDLCKKCNYRMRFINEKK